MGVENTFPPLAKSDYLDNRQAPFERSSTVSLAYKVNGKTYNGQMTTQGLDEEEIADVLNYICKQWGILAACIYCQRNPKYTA